ncbi:MAG: TIGR02281 family clan AA aspartic protease [Aquisalinus sp.]|nr:TIGR02281 family clan AA aspartic protease [Aquisalinus sp.]
MPRVNCQFTMGDWHMRDTLIGIVALGIISVFAVKHLDQKAASITATPQQDEQVMRTEPSYVAAAYADIIRIPRADNGHYYADLAINRRNVKVLVDTGASILALRESDAELAGLYPRHNDFTQPISTANGQTMAALMRADEVELGRLIVRDVDVFILPDESLAISLLGMNVLSELGSITFDKNELVIERSL